MMQYECRILLVDDETELLQMVGKLLVKEGYKHVDRAADCGEALRQTQENEYELVLLDVMLPDGDGFTLFEQIRRIKGSRLPVIFLSARDEAHARLRGLGLGADDYLTKPFQMLELAARVEAVLRRTKKAESEFVMGDLKCDFDSHQVFLNGTVVECTPKEYELLEVLIRNRNIALSREKLLDMVWGYDFDGGTRTVDVHIQRLRHKLHLENQIRTVYKLGYRLEVHE